MNRRMWIVVSSIAVLAVAWALFRPELLFINSRVNESFPSNEAGTNADQKLLASGNFHSVAHTGKGQAAIHQTNGKRILRFSDFETSNGPSLHVYLVAAPDAKDSAAVTSAGFIDLGPLKGNIGDQNYEVPSDVDLSRHRSVAVWCSRFNVNFATAPLTETR